MTSTVRAANERYWAATELLLWSWLPSSVCHQTMSARQ